MGSNSKFQLLKQGAEAKLYTTDFFGRLAIVKERFPKKYRHPSLDSTLSKERTKAEAKHLVKSRVFGIKTPAVYFVDLEENRIFMEYFNHAVTVREYIQKLQLQNDTKSELLLDDLAAKIGKTIAKLHSNNLIHGDLTTSNMLLANENEELVLIDFGLSYIEGKAEDKGVDLYVLERAILSTHPNSEKFFEAILNNYQSSSRDEAEEVIKKLDEIRLRGRKRTMVG